MRHLSHTRLSRLKYGHGKDPPKVNLCLWVIGVGHAIHQKASVHMTPTGVSNGRSAVDMTAKCDSVLNCQNIVWSARPHDAYPCVRRNQ